MLGRCLAAARLGVQDLGAEDMGVCPVPRGQAGVDRLLHDGVPEAQRRVRRAQDLGAPEPVGRLQAREVVEACHRGGPRGGGVAAEHGGSMGHGSRALGQPLEPQGDGSPYGLRGQTAHARGVLPGEARGTGAGQQCLHQEGHAARGGGHRLHELRRGVRESLAHGHLLHAVLVQWGQHLDAGERAGLDAIGQVRVGSGLPAGAGARDYEPEILETLGEVHEQLQRLAVHPLEVVHGQQHHLVLGQPAHEPGQPIEHGVACGPEIARLGTGQKRRGGARGGQQLSPAQGVRLGQTRLEELASHAEREAHLELAAPAAQGACPDPLCHPPDLRQQSRLPDARRPVEEQHRAVRPGVVERIGHEGETPFARHQMGRARNRVRLRKSPSHAEVF